MTDALRNALLDDEQLDQDIEPAPIPDNKELANIATLARRYTDLEKEIEDLEAKLKAKKAEWESLRGNALPLAMTEVGMKKFELVGGGKVVLHSNYVGAITEANKPLAHAWLEKSGNGSIIKHLITIIFDKGEEAWAKKFMRDMAARKKPLRYERKDSVHPQTLGKFIRESIANAKAEGLPPEGQIPFDLLGVFELRYAEVEQPKAQGG